MEKYGTYEVFKNKKTGEILREPFKGLKEDTPMEKKAKKEDNDWIKLEEDPKKEENEDE